jgi:hypothetical protein
MILEEKSGEDSAIFKSKRSTYHMDMMGHVIHILHTFFILISWNYLFLECVDDVLLSSLWSFNYSGFPLKEKEVASHKENKQFFDEEKWKFKISILKARLIITMGTILHNGTPYEPYALGKTCTFQEFPPCWSLFGSTPFKLSYWMESDCPPFEFWGLISARENK